MLLRIKLSIAALFLAVVSYAGNPVDQRTNDWSNAGNDNFFFAEKQINIQNNPGCDFKGNAYNDEALTEAIDELGDNGGVIFFDAGVYLFKNQVNIPSNVLIKGAGQTTILVFDLAQEVDAITFNGKLTNQAYELANSAIAGNNYIELVAANGLEIGDLIKIALPESDLTTSDWAKGSIAQLARIKSINGLTVELENPLRLKFDINEVEITKIDPVKNAGISCLNIQRKDATNSQTSNIKFNYAENCFAKGIQSDYCNFAHIEINYSYKVQVSESYFRLAHDYGRGGKGYGIALQFASSDCLIENNIFSTLRHAVLFQAGANGNVVAYNYSIKPFWNEPNFPENAAGDIVLHGNYPFGNLIEGNIAQNIVVDDSHGKNGPANLFMNNTAELYGFFINPNAADSQIIIDNKITNKAFLKGNYYVFGEGHYEYGNKVKSKYVPSNTTESEYGSFYRSKYSCKLSSEYRIKAEMRYKEGIYTECWEDTRISDDATFNEGYVGIDNHQNSELSLYPNPAQHSITIETVQPVLITVYNLSGAQILTTNQKVIDVSNWQKGTYLFIIKEKETQITTNKRVLVN